MSRPCHLDVLCSATTFSDFSNFTTDNCKTDDWQPYIHSCKLACMYARRSEDQHQRWTSDPLPSISPPSSVNTRDHLPSKVSRGPENFNKAMTRSGPVPVRAGRYALRRLFDSSAVSSLRCQCCNAAVFVRGHSLLVRFTIVRPDFSADMDPLPYNVTISSQTASIVYAPTRDGPLASGWNVSYSGGTHDTGYGVPQGVGADSHSTALAGSTMTLNWVGSAVYLYGQSTSASYSIDVDGAGTTLQTADVPQGGLLGSKTGLKYGNHTVVLTTFGGTVAFQYAELSIGIGYQNSTSQPVNSTILAVNENGTAPSPNSFFTYQSTNTPHSWQIEGTHNVLYTNGSFLPFPQQMLTSVLGESVSFVLTNTSAFFLWGAVNNDHGVKTVDIVPVNNPSQTISTSINDVSSALDFKQILCWSSGLDRDQSYLVRVTDEQQAASFSFSSLDTIDGGPVPVGSSQSSGATSTAAGGAKTAAPDGSVSSGKSGLSTGAIAGIAVAGAVVLLLVVGFLFWRRRRRSVASWDTPQAQPIIFSTTNDGHIAPGVMSATYSSTSVPLMMSETDAGRIDVQHVTMLPPEYQSGWTQSEPSIPPTPTASDSTGGREVRALPSPPSLGVSGGRAYSDRKNNSDFM